MSYFVYRRAGVSVGRPPGPELENCTDRESYSLASGLALGMVMFGKGTEMSSLSDLCMADELYHYMVGGHKRPLVSETSIITNMIT